MEMGHSILPDSSSPSISVAVGITVGLIASLIQSLGLTIQRKSHILNQAQPEEARKADYRRPLWLLGFTIFLSSNILGSIFQIASLPVVILAPLGAVSLLWNAFFARVILGDVFSRYMLFGTLFVVVGAVLIGIYGIVPEPAHSLDDLLRLFGRTSFVVYFTLLGVTVMVILVITHIAEWNYNRHQPILLESEPSTPVQQNSLPLVPPASTLPTASEMTPLLMDVDGKQQSHSSIRSFGSRTPTILAISYASISGLISGMCLIFAKSAVELLVLTAGGSNQFGRWESWLLVFALGVFALLQLWYLHKSLTLEDPTLVCPLAFCSYNLSSILNGLIYFDQFERLTSKQLGLVITGIVILLAGVGAVSMQDATTEGEPEGGITDGDWTVAEAVASSPPVSPGFARRPGYMTSPRRAATEFSNEEDEDILLSPGFRSSAARRTVSSPSAFSGEGGGTALELVLEESALHGESRPTPSVSSLLPLATSSGSPSRIRTTSESSQKPRPEPRSPPRRRGRRRSSLLSPGIGVSVSGDLHRGLTDGGADTVDAGSPPPPPLPGFSFGLSPLSPGFSLIPRQRESINTLESGHGGASTADTEGGREGRAHGRWSAVKNVVKSLAGRRTS